jgi:hypothetical protein
MTEDTYDELEPMDVRPEPPEYLDDDAFVAEDSDNAASGGPLARSRSGIAWREIEKYREKKALEKILKDELYEDVDINEVWDSTEEQ